jgi:hypothetical protein
MKRFKNFKGRARETHNVILVCERGNGFEESKSSATIQDLDRIPWAGHCVSSLSIHGQAEAVSSEVAASPFSEESSDAKTKLQRRLKYKHCTMFVTVLA